MRMLSPDARKLLASQVEEWHQALLADPDGPAISYLAARGIDQTAVGEFRLGWDGERLVIPYLTPAGPWQVKRRCISHLDCKAVNCPKYLGPDGLDPHLFNAQVLRTAETVVVVEGELDVVAGWSTGIDHVGHPGADTWVKHGYWVHAFDSVSTIVVVADGDPVRDGKKVGHGEEAARRIAGDLRKHYSDKTVNVVVMPIPYDANSYIHENGPMEYLEFIGLI
jgi:DNA primase